jgi:uncharacterized SAM-dependent methyltransferase
MTPFKQDVIDLFSGKRGGHVEHWLYSDTLRKEYSGSQLWQEFLKASKDYYVLNNEIDLIARNATKIASALPAIDAVIDFGVGDGQALQKKVLPIVESLKTVKSYIGVDLSNEFLRNAQNTITTTYPDMDIQTIQTDFFKTSFPLPPKNSLGLMLGSTITNLDMKMNDVFPRNHIVNRLKHLKALMSKDNHLLISYDANTDPKSVKEAYSNEYWGRHVTGIMYDVEGLTKGDFSTEDWKHTRIWNSEAHVLHQCAESTRHQHFYIDDYCFDIPKGKQFVTVNNFKFPTPLFQSMCEEVGFEVKDYYTDNQNRMQLQLLGT